MKRRREVLELGTVERWAHDQMIWTDRAVTNNSGEVTGRGYGMAVKLPSAVHKIADRHPDDITPALIGAADELLSDWDGAGISSPITALYGVRAAGSDEMSDAAASAFARYQAALRSIGLPIVRSVVVNVVIHDRIDARVNLLKIGLTQIGRHYSEIGRPVG
jgi:hypothetical protein